MLTKEMLQAIKDLDSDFLKFAPAKTFIGPYEFGWNKNKKIFYVVNHDTKEVMENTHLPPLQRFVIYNEEYSGGGYFDLNSTINWVRDFKFLTNEYSAGDSFGLSNADVDVDIFRDPKNPDKCGAEVTTFTEDPEDSDILYSVEGTLGYVKAGLINFLTKLKSGAKITDGFVQTLHIPETRFDPEDLDGLAISDFSGKEINFTEEDVWSNPRGSIGTYDEIIKDFYDNYTTALGGKDYSVAEEEFRKDGWDESWFEKPKPEIRYCKENNKKYLVPGLAYLADIIDTDDLIDLGYYKFTEDEIWDQIRKADLEKSPEEIKKEEEYFKSLGVWDSVEETDEGYKIYSDISGKEITDLDHVWMTNSGKVMNADEVGKIFKEKYTRSISEDELQKAIEWLKRQNEFAIKSVQKPAEFFNKLTVNDIRYCPEADQYVLYDSDLANFANKNIGLLTITIGGFKVLGFPIGIDQDDLENLYLTENEAEENEFYEIPLEEKFERKDLK